MDSKDEAYVYVIKNPSYNDICVAAWDSVLYSGTPVIYETRYGLDLGIIVSPAPVSMPQKVKNSGEIKGSCLRFGSMDEEMEYYTDSNAHQCESCPGCMGVREPVKVSVEGDVLWIDHLATPNEMARYRENQEREDEALKICREKIKKHKLDMKLITTHFLLGEAKVLFFFTADVRVDFRDLVKDLVSVFKMRIELRQIGVRDESRLIGGLSVCGRDCCCHLFTDKPSPVSIKMAKEQNLSLNSSKISGACGRLLCCLAYEYDNYVEEKADCPGEGTRIRIDHELWKVSEVNILSRKIMMQGPDGRVLYIPFDEVCFNQDTDYWEIREEYLAEIFS